MKSKFIKMLAVGMMTISLAATPVLAVPSTVLETTTESTGTFVDPATGENKEGTVITSSTLDTQREWETYLAFVAETVDANEEGEGKLVSDLVDLYLECKNSEDRDIEEFQKEYQKFYDELVVDAVRFGFLDENDPAKEEGVIEAASLLTPIFTTCAYDADGNRIVGATDIVAKKEVPDLTDDTKPEDLRVVYYDSVEQKWIVIPVDEVDLVNKTITFTQPREGFAFVIDIRKVDVEELN
ncbi:MAG: hypothetical protein Q4C77_05880 [Eubacteriales bacterium]|nr:hypothetical protein [Eubacteriales bacterium]